MVEYLINDVKTPLHLNRVYETDMSESLKALALEGHGMAFLPFSAVHKEIQARKLVQVHLSSGPSLEITMEIRIYRQKIRSKLSSHLYANQLWNKLASEIDKSIKRVA
jgi:DNA-binding transcriptional LysR family regulator